MAWLPHKKKDKGVNPRDIWELWRFRALVFNLEKLDEQEDKVKKKLPNGKNPIMIKVLPEKQVDFSSYGHKKKVLQVLAGFEETGNLGKFLTDLDNEDYRINGKNYF